MIKTYSVTGMTCSGCQAKVESLLAKVPGVKSVRTHLAKGEAEIDTDHPVLTGTLSAALKEQPRYQLGAIAEKPLPPAARGPEKSGFETYKPILLIFGYLFGITLVQEWLAVRFDWKNWMTHFMGGFFLVFSFFKLLNLRGFAGSYAMYDVLAKKWFGWGYVYAFLELGLGIAFLTGFKPYFTNGATLLLMSVSIIGVLQSVRNKRKIQCACLGAVFNLPMSTVTIVEDLLMMVMSGLMLVNMF